jgi:hypothetical protein
MGICEINLAVALGLSESQILLISTITQIFKKSAKSNHQ